MQKVLQLQIVPVMLFSYRVPAAIVHDLFQLFVAIVGENFKRYRNHPNFNY